jgi:hypothetical protein
VFDFLNFQLKITLVHRQIKIDFQDIGETGCMKSKKIRNPGFCLQKFQTGDVPFAHFAENQKKTNRIRQVHLLFSAPSGSPKSSFVICHS